MGVLYELLAERPRENWISHERMPTMGEHQAFVRSRPFWHWYLIDDGMQFVGALECTHLNEIGVAVLKQHQHKGYGTLAVNLFIQQHKPLPRVPAVRNGRWLANIATHNEHSKDFFKRLGFRPIQETYAL